MSTKGHVRGLVLKFGMQANKIDMTSKRHAKALVFKIWKQSNVAPKGQVWGLSSNLGCKQTNRCDFGKALIVKLWKRANKQT